MATFHVPLAWTPDDPSYSFQDWKIDITLWRAATDIPEAKQGAAVAQRITGVTGNNFIRFACEATNVTDIQIIHGDGRPKIDPFTGAAVRDAEETLLAGLVPATEYSTAGVQIRGEVGLRPPVSQGDKEPGLVEGEQEDEANVRTYRLYVA